MILTARPETLEKFQAAADELKTTAAESQKALSALTALTKRLGEVVDTQEPRLNEIMENLTVSSSNLNEALGANFEPAAFEHLARYDTQLGRIEMHLISSRPQQVDVAGRRIEFAAGEAAALTLRSSSAGLMREVGSRLPCTA